MKIADRIIEAIKPLDKALANVELSLQKSAKEKEAELERRKKVLGKNFDKSFVDMTDDEIKAIFSKEKAASILKVVQRKRKMDKAAAKKKPVLKNQKGQKKDIISTLLGGGTLLSITKKEEIKPGIWKVSGLPGKFKFEATIDTKKKTISFKGNSEDVPFVMSNASKAGFKFK